jgi:hypothetical protein
VFTYKGEMHVPPLLRASARIAVMPSFSMAMTSGHPVALASAGHLQLIQNFPSARVRQEERTENEKHEEQFLEKSFALFLRFLCVRQVGLH